MKIYFDQAQMALVDENGIAIEGFQVETFSLEASSRSTGPRVTARLYGLVDPDFNVPPQMTQKSI